MNNLDLILSCPVCGKKYDQQNIKIVQSNQRGFLVHFNCKHCESSSLAIISRAKGEHNLVALGMITDLNYQEAISLLEKKPINSDEVIDLYENLKKRTF